MFEAVDSPYLVQFDGSFRQSTTPTGPPADAPDHLKKRLKKTVERFADLQERLYAENRRSLLLVFQAMDAAGKDSTIRAITKGVNAAGFQVSSFKRPSELEIDHDFLWRTNRQLPERGRVGIFNRSYYEETLVVRVHPGILDGRPRPSWQTTDDALWERRYSSIRDHERHLAADGTTILKFWLKVGRQEQARRFLSRIDEPSKNWKFAHGDIRERALWPAYHEAYEQAVAATSKPWAPWYAIPADDKPYMRWAVADIVVRSLEAMDPRFPDLPAEERAKMQEAATVLRAELDAG